jgi:GT2 family glycosyltransferase
MPPSMPDPVATRLSIVIVTHNSRDAIRVAMPAVRDQLRRGDELVVVDNDSSDGTVPLVRELAPDAIVVSNGVNVGFAAGANAGAREARGELLVFLNPDATPQSGFVDAIAAPLRDGRGWAAWMGLVTADGGRVVNTNGGVVHFTGIAWAGDAGAASPGSLRDAREVTFLSGACLAVPKDTWVRSRGFAEDFFMYHEDVDLSLRLRLGGV